MRAFESDKTITKYIPRFKITGYIHSIYRIVQDTRLPRDYLHAHSNLPLFKHLSLGYNDSLSKIKNGQKKDMHRLVHNY